MSARAACVIGWPVKHSRSPLIHNYWIAQHRLNAVYRREEVAPEAFAEFISQLAARGYVEEGIASGAGIDEAELRWFAGHR